MTLSPTEILQGILTVTFIVSFILVGCRILLKYTKSKKIEHITMGLAWIFLGSAWSGSAVNFIFTLFGSPLPDLVFLILSNAFVPIAIITWLYSIFHILLNIVCKFALTIYKTAFFAADPPFNFFYS